MNFSDAVDCLIWLINSALTISPYKTESLQRKINNQFI